MNATIIFDLPSKGLLYSKDNILSDGQLELRYGTALDEDILLNASYIRTGQTFYKLIESLIVNKNVNIDDMLIVDYNAAIISSRISMYGDEYSANIVCPICGNKSRKEIILNQNSYKFYEKHDKQVELNKNEFKFKSKFNNEFVVRLLTVKDEKEISRIKKLALSQNRPYNEVFQYLRYSIVSVNGKNKPEEILVFIKTMSSIENKELKKFINEISPTAKLTTDYICGNCGHGDNLEVDLDVNFFWETE
jgi:hypothetical protein